MEAAIGEVSGRVLDITARIDTLTSTVCPAHMRQIAYNLKDEAAAALGQWQYRLVNDPDYSSRPKQLDELGRLEAVLLRILKDLESYCLR